MSAPDRQARRPTPACPNRAATPADQPGGESGPTRSDAAGVQLGRGPRDAEPTEEPGHRCRSNLTNEPRGWLHRCAPTTPRLAGHRSRTGAEPHPALDPTQPGLGSFRPIPRRGRSVSRVCAAPMPKSRHRTRSAHAGLSRQLTPVSRMTETDTEADGGGRPRRAGQQRGGFKPRWFEMPADTPHHWFDPTDEGKKPVDPGRHTTPTGMAFPGHG